MQRFHRGALLRQDALSYGFGSVCLQHQRRFNGRNTALRTIQAPRADTRDEIVARRIDETTVPEL